MNNLNTLNKIESLISVMSEISYFVKIDTFKIEVTLNRIVLKLEKSYTLKQKSYTLNKVWELESNLNELDVFNFCHIATSFNKEFIILTINF